MRATPLLLGLSLSAPLAACGPAQIEVDPSKVVDVHVAPASQQLLFCPGDAFLVEVVAKLDDGTSCSTHDPARGCMGKSNALLDVGRVHLEGTNGVPGNEPLIWVPDGDPLKTAGTGLALKAWITGEHGGKSMEGDASLKPVYDCKMDVMYGGGIATGNPGAPGPNLTIAITPISTPYYADAALVRVEFPGQRVYLISPSADRPVKITTRGQDGMPGPQGPSGVDGKPGADTATPAAACSKGGEGTPGTDGGAGGPGGDGGPGGTITVLLDDKAADKLRGRVLLTSNGGAAGPGGKGGWGGKGGPGGKGSQPGPDCMDNTGPAGKSGANGADGAAGKAGAPGPAPTYENKPREALFGTELAAIQAIEATKAH
ncbi:MAG: hypothetical protein U0414_13745 [Polyangiaceae bacterium]